MLTHFKHVKTTQWYLSVLEEGCFFFDIEMERFLPIIGDKSPKGNLDWRVWVQTRFWAILFAPAEMSRAKGGFSTWQNKCFWGYGYTWNWLSHYNDDATISHNDENRNSLQASSPFKGFERSHAGVAREKRRLGKSSLFPPPLTPSPVASAFACQSKWRGCTQSITFLGDRTLSLFGERVYVRNCEAKFELFTY